MNLTGKNIITITQVKITNKEKYDRKYSKQV